MRVKIVSSILVCLFLFNMGLVADAADAHDDRCVILVSVDGLANFYLDDPLADMPFLKNAAKNGARADGLVCSFPTVTWPNHTTLVTGTTPAKHGVISNNYLDRKSATSVAFIPDPLFDKDQILKVPTVYDVAHNAGLVTAGIIWPATRNTRTLDWTVPDMFGKEAWPKYGTKVWLDELRKAGLPVDLHGDWTREKGGGVKRDWLYSRMARHLFQNHPPNLLMIHLVEVDHIEHQYGPRSPEAYWSVSYIDDRLRDIAEAIKLSPHGDKTTLVIASDHGFYPITKDIRPNVLLKKAGLLSKEKKQVYCLAQGGASMVYILDVANRAETIKKLKKQFAAVEGVQAVLDADEYTKLGQPTPAEDSRAPDLWLAAKTGYSFSNSDGGEDVVAPRKTKGGTHGYLPDDPDMLGSLVISGYGIKPGTKLPKTLSLDVAPTIAKLLGVKLPTAQGKALTKALVED
ncbi:alkaline phosphatase family protein [uncultured Gimesia sp.]|uniref:alkaline phosphatase family protein n=1 Tax=uncultured Gimesia sp. TaxID=1678688 RepID=UPI002603B30E|nr:ectonucleotide pyrophosphatase/phosphodiesterase [uncultured Gimesia sp.]